LAEEKKSVEGGRESGGFERLRKRERIGDGGRERQELFRKHS